MWTAVLEFSWDRRDTQRPGWYSKWVSPVHKTFALLLGPSCLLHLLLLLLLLLLLALVLLSLQVNKYMLNNNNNTIWKCLVTGFFFLVLLLNRQRLLLLLLLSSSSSSCFTKFRRTINSFVTSVRPSVRPHGTTQLPLDENSARLKYDKNNGYLTYRPMYCTYSYDSIALNHYRMKNISGKSVEKIKTRIAY